jgi:SAM-dependent methyltransferase
VLEHLEDDVGFLREIHRVLRPGGTLFFSCPVNPDYWTYYDKVVGHERRYRGSELRERLAATGFVIDQVCARHDRMDGWFGAVFGFGTKYLSRFTAGIVRRYLPEVAARQWEWQDGDDFTEAEQRGGVTVRAHKRGPT